MPWIFWNGLFCREISRDGDYWTLETMTGARYRVDWSNLELAHFKRIKQ